MFRTILFVLILFALSFYVVNDAYALTIFQRPDGLGSGGNWGGSGTFDDINETGRDDTDFITSDRIGGNQQDTVVFSLSDGVDPVVDIDHVVRYTFKEDGTGSSSPQLEVTLKQGDTDLITWIEASPLPNVFTLAIHEVPPSVVSQIGNYNDIRLEFKAKCSGCPNPGDGGANNDSVSVSWAELQYETYTTPRDHPPPKIVGIGFYKITPQNQTTNNIVKISNYSKYSDITDPQNYGKYKKSGKFYNVEKSFPTFEGKIGEPLQVQIKLDGVFASTRIEHVSLIASGTESDFKSSNFEIIADKGKKIAIIDPNKILKDAQFAYSLEDGSLWVNFDILFQKPFKSNIVLQAWDELRRPVYSNLHNAWEIIDPLQNIVPVVETPDRAKVTIIRKTLPSDCTENKTCFEPKEITIRKGGSIVWKNEDSILHTIISGTPTKGFDGRFNFALIPQRSKEQVFSLTGNYSYYCSLHPWYVGTIIVSDSKEVKPHHFVDFDVMLSDNRPVVNGQTMLIEDRNTNMLLSGHLPNTVKPVPIKIQIIKPDGSDEVLSVKTTDEGYYWTQAKFTKKWQTGKFEIISKYKGKEVGHINFTISDKTIKR